MADLPTDEARRALADKLEEELERVRQTFGTLDYCTHMTFILPPDDVRLAIASLRAKTAGGAGEMREDRAREAAMNSCASSHSSCACRTFGWEGASKLCRERLGASYAALLSLDPSPQGEGGGKQGAPASPSGSQASPEAPSDLRPTGVDPSRGPQQHLSTSGALNMEH